MSNGDDRIMSDAKQSNDAVLEAKRRAHAELKELRSSEGPSFLERHGVQPPSSANTPVTTDKKPYKAVVGYLGERPPLADPGAIALFLLEGILDFDAKNAQETDAYCSLDGANVLIHPVTGTDLHLVVSPREARVLAARLLAAAAEAEKQK